jgi:hypothetical protein
MPFRLGWFRFLLWQFWTWLWVGKELSQISSLSGSKEFFEHSDSRDPQRDGLDWLRLSHCGHNHTHDELIKILHISFDIRRQFMWNHELHWSHFIPSWLGFTWLEHTPQLGHLSPGFSSISPPRRSKINNDETFAEHNRETLTLFAR